MVTNSAILKKFPKRTFKNFLSLKKGMPVSEVRKIVGEPDKDIGSGLYIFVYTMPDNSTVTVSCSSVLLSVHGLKKGLVFDFK